MPVKLAPQVRPQPTDYAAHYEKYVSLVPGTDILGVLEAQRMLTTQLLGARSEREGNFRYAPDKWTVKEVVGHLADSERIFAYRALRISRGDKTPIEGFEQDDYIAGANFNACSLTNLTTEFELVRRSNLAMFKQFSDEAWTRMGTASENPISVRALAYIIAGHERHHREILLARYL